MRKYSASEICLNLGDICEDCGDYSKFQPCNTPVPNYIPRCQIEKFIESVRISRKARINARK